MKHIKALTLFSLLTFSAPLFAAQTVTKDLGTFSAWKVTQVKEHTLWNKEACLASTPAQEDSGITLELYAEKSASGEGYIEPTIQVVTKAKATFVRAVLFDDQKSEQYNLTLATNENEPPGYGLLTRLDDRAKLIDLLKRAGKASVKLYDAKNVAIKTLNFSLAGSRKGLDAAIAGCGLSL